ncbi:hypothetical protein [Amycolatopsis sp. SID8362]|uniref:hypothetical protein n=1 Tax=Amycolatopsis sp. SID8362 TaxID=2690346 RepID=UPI00136AD76B|nr:hypothetical protein [Amycolatopsis sp. SID8362]NBH02902.1 hypothetical protein [Amycolatopsis sp. SID8362]NED39603.1 hypothetical protein [Amycolatopsis sp. SID8362]
MTVYDDPVRQIARVAARRLENGRWPGLKVATEAALDDRHGTTPHRPADQYVDGVSLAALIVAAADLAWAVYAELRTKSSNTTQVIINHLRVELPHPRVLEPGDRDQVIEVVAEEVVRSQDQVDD